MIDKNEGMRGQEGERTTYTVNLRIDYVQPCRHAGENRHPS
jgi:hypothetical protein